MLKPLSFEEPLLELNKKIEKLKDLSDSSDVDLGSEIKKMQDRSLSLKKEIFQNLTPIQVVEVARHSSRPDSTSLFKIIFDKFFEIHGDRLFRDDPSIVAGLATLGEFRCVVLGHQKGHDTKENIFRNFGMPHPEGYRKALRVMNLAAKFKLPIISFIDTPGAYPGIDAEKRGQAEAIAQNLKIMSDLPVPILSCVIGEGGSGGALGIGVSNRLHVLEYSIYSVISPEGCASILLRDATKSDFVSKKLKITAKDMIDLKVADQLIPEPPGGAHNNWEETAENIKRQFIKDLEFYKKQTTDFIIEERYNKFRNLGRFQEN